MAALERFDAHASIADPRQVQDRLNRELEHVDATQLIVHLSVCIFLLAISIAASARYCQCLGADDDESARPDARRRAHSLCDSLLVPTLLDAVFGGNRRRTRLRRFSLDP